MEKKKGWEFIKISLASSNIKENFRMIYQKEREY